MPIFDLECLACGHVQRDVLMSVKVDPGTLACPACHAIGKLKKKPCRVHARFYGDGFYKQHRKGD